MAAAVAQSPPPEVDLARIDQRVMLYGHRFEDYETLLAVRGERSAVRMFFLQGVIELMSPSVDHEGIKTTIARLLEAWADEHELEVNGFGSWTLKSAEQERGAEPDECYVVGAPRKDRPDIAIEVQWTRGGLDKLEIYRGLGVREVWIWQPSGKLEVHALRGERYQLIPRSEVLPTLDLDQLAPFVLSESQSQAVRAYRAELRAK